MRQLTSSEFEATMKKALARFAQDWSRRRVDEPGVFPDSQADLFWWEAFSEFAQAELFNQGPAQAPPIRA